MIEIVIVDDEPKNISILKQLLTFCEDALVVGEAQNIEEAVAVIQKQKPSLVLLDIEMPGGNAFDLLDKIMPVQFEIVFITAFDAYALKAFKYSALDYLLKPVSIDELKISLQRVREKIAIKTPDYRLQNLVNNIALNDHMNQKIAVQNAKNGYEFVLVKDILYIKSTGGYTYVYVSDKKQYISSKTLKEFEEMLPPHLFFRCHHSFIVNLKRVKKYEKGRGGALIMENDVNLEVAVRRKEELLEKLKVR